MCLAILMYLVTGTLAFLWHVAMTVGIFLLTLLGKAILFVCASIYTVARPRHSEDSQSSSDVTSSGQPFVTMYPEIGNFDDDYETMARVSLETVTSGENSPRQRFTSDVKVDSRGSRIFDGTTASSEGSSDEKSEQKADGKNERQAKEKDERIVDKKLEARMQRGSQIRKISK